jgi:type II secretory pathway pseudopilin PulG
MNLTVFRGSNESFRLGEKVRMGPPILRSAAGFTLVEIAISVAVIAFALVAVIGLLPLGMETQRDNRQETIANHDGTYLLEAIRGGSASLDELPRFVDALNGAPLPNGATGADVIRALSAVNSTNTAIMRAISGAASARSTAAKDFAMHYKVICQVLPASGLNSVEGSVAYAPELVRSLYEVRLALYWPVVPATGVVPDGARRQVFRTLVSGMVDANGFLNTSAFVKP